MSGYAKVRRKLYKEDGKVLVSLTVGNESGCEDVELLILGELFEQVGEKLNDGELDGETVARLDELAHATAAFSSACASLAFTQSSANALLKKLLGKGFSREASEAAVTIAVERGYIDESSIARRRAEIMVSKLWGRSRIISKLRTEGFSACAMGDVCMYLEDVDFIDNCALAMQKKYSPIPTERRERDKMYASLARLGYSSSDIKGALKYLNDEE